MKFDRLMDVLLKMRKNHPALAQRLSEAEAVSRWDAAVGPAIAKHARALRVQDQVLWVEVDHPIWKSELHHRKQQILEILNRQNLSLKDLLLVDPRPPGGADSGPRPKWRSASASRQKPKNK